MFIELTLATVKTKTLVKFDNISNIRPSYDSERGLTMVYFIVFKNGLQASIAVEESYDTVGKLIRTNRLNRKGNINTKRKERL